MDALVLSVAYAAVAGITMPLGGLLARIEHIRPAWLESELRHSVMAFGGGVLIAAIALVLVPKGMQALPVAGVMVAFGGGGVVFFLIDRAIEKHGGGAAQLLAMLLDFVPESLALGAMLAVDAAAGLLLALLIALQNLPEGFNAYRELVTGGNKRPAGVLAAFCACVLLGPLAAVSGHLWLADQPRVIGAVMLFAAGGIFYLIFEDIAPQAKLARHWAPPLGAVAGFMLGMLGHALLH